MKFSLNKLALAAVLAIPAMAMASVGGTGMLGGRHDFATDAAVGISAQAYNADGTLKFTADANGDLTIPVMETVKGKFTATQTKAVGLCSFCHTPHSASSTALLWNRAANNNAYTWSDAATTTGGTTLGIGSLYVGPTAKCLACHDGSVAVGDVGNYMGSKGVYNIYKVGDRRGTLVDVVDANGVVTGQTWNGADGGAKVSKQVGVGGDMTGAHPVGVPYPYLGAMNQYNGIWTGTQVVRSDYVATPVVSAAGVAGVKLYNDSGSAITAGAVATKSGIECSSCHDVHNKQSVDDNMLRGKQAGSTRASGYLCLQCHAKAD